MTVKELIKGFCRVQGFGKRVVRDATQRLTPHALGLVAACSHCHKDFFEGDLPTVRHCEDCRSLVHEACPSCRRNLS